MTNLYILIAVKHIFRDYLESEILPKINDYRYYKEFAKDSDARYMKLKLVEKYLVGQYSLKELKENGLTSVQGQSKATVQLMKYLEKQLTVV